MAINPQEMTVISSRKGRLHIKFSAAFRIDDAGRMLDDIRERAEADNASYLLLDLSDYTGKFTVLQRLQLAVAVVTRLRRYRLAGVFSETTFDPRQLGQTMAQNRGANLRTFSNLGEAELWLGYPAGEPAVLDNAI